MALNTPAVIPAAITPPVVIDLGKTRSKRLKDLKNGRGKLVDQVREVVDRVRVELGDQARDKHLIPVVVVFRKKSKKRAGRGLAMPCLF